MKKRSHQAIIYETQGIVIHGKGMGKYVGMPTANIKILSDEKLPEQGVYISKVLLKGQWFYGVTHIGKRPTVDDSNEISFETHIMNFNENIYGQDIRVQLFAKIREPKKFEELTELFNQIRKDCCTAYTYWGIKNDRLDLVMDVETYEVKVNNRKVKLANKEFDVLYLLYSNPDVIFTKKQIYEAIWHKPVVDNGVVVVDTVYRIRRKLKEYSTNQEYIKTVSKKGYKYNV